MRIIEILTYEPGRSEQRDPVGDTLMQRLARPFTRRGLVKHGFGARPFPTEINTDAAGVPAMTADDVLATSRSALLTRAG